MKKNKKRIFAGSTCDQIVYFVSDRSSKKKNAPEKFRFKDEEEREQHKRGISLRHCIQLVNANFTPSGYFATLTFDDENEQIFFDDAKRIRAAFIRKIRNKFPDVKIICFLGRGKSTERIHMHMIFEGADPETVNKLWTFGEIRKIEHLRQNQKDAETGEEIGADYSSLATYLFNHWTKEQGGHRYYKTKNLQQPEEEAPTECILSYSPSKPPKAPKGYKFVKCTANTLYGFQSFHYVRIRKPQNMKQSKSLNLNFKRFKN